MNLISCIEKYSNLNMKKYEYILFYLIDLKDVNEYIIDSCNVWWFQKEK